MLSDFSLKDKVIIVTGATGVLGEAFVQCIAEQKGAVVLIGRNEEVGNARANSITTTGRRRDLY